MNQRSGRHTSKWLLLPGLATLGMLAVLALILRGIQDTAPTDSSISEAQAATNTATPVAPNYPPDRQTADARFHQTQEAAALTPSPSGTIVWSFPPITDTPSPADLTQGPATPAGDGVIIDDVDSVGGQAVGKLLGLWITTKWYAEVGDKHINVFAGVDIEDDAQGVVYVRLFTADGRMLFDGGRYLTPVKAGEVRIVGAEGQRLILSSANGQTFYFDVPGQRFVSSLTEAVPTATLWPTLTLEPTYTPSFTDDVANNPWNVSGLSPANTNLRFTISPVGDTDWFRFHLPVTSTIQIHLESLPANYDLYVYSASHPEIGGQSTKSRKSAELVIITDAQPDDYYVEIVGVDGAWDANNTYQLRFIIPGIGGP